jgi:PAS domain S-box-containing protein
MPASKPITAMLLCESQQNLSWIEEALAGASVLLEYVMIQTAGDLPDRPRGTVPPALILCGLSATVFSPASVMQWCKNVADGIPIIVVGDKFDLACWKLWMQTGAFHYVVREHGRLLAPTVDSVTQRQRAAGTPRRPGSEGDYLAATFAATTDFVAICNPAGTVLWLNHAARRLLRLGSQTRTDRVLISDFYPGPIVARMLYEAIPEAVRKGVWTGETVWLAGQSHEVPTSQVIVAHQTEDGEVDFLSIIARDISERKRAEQILRHSEERFRAAAGCASDLIYEWDLITGRQIWFGDIDGLLNYEPGQFPRTRSAWQKILYPEDQERVLDAVVRHLTTGSHFAEEYRVSSMGHLQHDWLDRGIALRDDQGKPIRWVGVVTDITDRKRTEAALKASTRFARSTVDALSAQIAILNESGTIIAINKAWRDFALANPPSSRTAWKGANYLDVCERATGHGAEMATEFAQGIRAVMSSELEEFSLEYPGHSPSEQRWFLGRVTRFPDGGPLRIVVAHENITARKLAEQETFAGNSHLPVLAKNLPVGLFRANPQGHYLCVNDAWLRLTGLSQADAIGGAWERTIHPNDRHVLREWSRCIQEKRSCIMEYRVQRPDGSVAWMLSQVEVEKDPANNILGFTGTLTDVSSIKETCHRLTHELDRLKRLLPYEADPQTAT